MSPHFATMLSICSACSSPSLISFHIGTKTVSSIRKFIAEDKNFLGNKDATHPHGVSVKIHAARSLHMPARETLDQAGSMDSSIFSRYPDEFDDIVHGFSNKYFDSEPDKWSSSAREINGSYPIDSDLKYLASSTVSETEELPLDKVFVGDNVNELNTQTITEKQSILGTDLQPSESLVGDELNTKNVLTELTTPGTDLQPPASVNGNELLDSLSQTSSNLPDLASSGSEPVSNSLESTIPENTASVSDSFEAANRGISDVRKSINDAQSGFHEFFDTSYNSFSSSIKDTVKGVTESFDNGVSSLLSSVENSKEQTGGKLVGLSGELKDSTFRAGMLAIDILRQAIVSLEGSLTNGTKFIVYSYESTKTLLPIEARSVLDLSEGKVTEILKPVGSAFQQVGIVVEMFERSLGLDPNDPIVPFIFFLGTSATLGVSYWVVKYSGYSGDLSPELTLELLKEEEKAVLIDVRPEDLREREGVPDLRRGARFKYASVTLPEEEFHRIDTEVYEKYRDTSSVEFHTIPLEYDVGEPRGSNILGKICTNKVDSFSKKLLKNVKEVDDALLAVVIRNLKIVQDGSKVIVMDSSGDRAKGIARSLRKLGVKRPYLVQGGFQSWIRTGLRIKELKPDTTLSILNEEAEAILEEIRPTPVLIIGYVLALIASVYALLEWEKTLQLIGVVGLGQTLYRRIASYEDSEDFKQDVRLLLAPVTLGAQAFSWAAGKLEPNKIGLPTSPSSTAVQDRVLQAAAKHESQPSDADEIQTQSLESTSQAGENLDLSEA